MNFELRCIVLFAALFSGPSFGRQNVLIQPLEIEFAIQGIKLVVHSKGGVCAVGGRRPFRLVIDEVGKRYRFICKVRLPGFRYDSEMPITVLEKFREPQHIYADIKALKAKFHVPSAAWDDKNMIHSVQRNWGIEYSWSPPTKQNWRYSYLCPRATTDCLRVIHRGMEKLNFDIQKLVY